jgi:hypothetical protein
MNYVATDDIFKVKTVLFQTNFLNFGFRFILVILYKET